ncbi:methionyl-tRNA formyltransferase/UDP-4-amino-4-deoxy-L-arabinose formyltransferase/UDP-glucuronic acid dehydrogenase (UDP-4-keto-hexauronic acid decarboxylating) [Ruminiclostridium sufflavum DSM 19573]|uniref:Methionyl-tRNA formyltransferase/UDP-4-amino-4-deoxy-L-arabinose formyltransferase/UDP-glucuronic acid dehydrogenase (UDP-4-keto-hexauronic acid decarboxylating) n=1 Tax=Ruminiclostridium sufflavum DSM 19573 TaxID=1121337 RepID=A0A318Y9Q6_9FIRM|nr:methionyl-tRNA formyltransferase [Ruminiclostridium sufflavum]PYG89123.1 methionyl-tRNA formyltransferase/UDP-4-amino-4-deoxy-L-arabinose formyltransferase/UDP-glucuronic acid dehydrogenase (UDP-4-keto-hexauronic acid decarboxylating) [Ruminiclostridium sufflavum DSM 19573]
MRMVFMGGHKLGKDTLQYLIDKRKDIIAVVTNIENDWYTGVDEVAEKNGLLLYKNVDVNSESFINEITALKPDLIVVVNFQQILKEQLINIPQRGCINTHAALLPKYRGRAPLNWAVIHGERQVGVTVHYIEKGIDTGDIIIQKSIDIGDEEYIDSVLEKVKDVYPTVVNNAVNLIQSGDFVRIKQDLSKGNYFGKRTPEDGQINWNNNTKDIFNLIRAISKPYPGAFSFCNNSRLIIWRAEVINQKEEESLLPNGYIITINKSGICVKTKNDNILITEYDMIDKTQIIENGQILKFKETKNV